MKIEFIEEIKVDGTIIWFTKRNGSYVADTLKYNEKEAREIFEYLKTNPRIGEKVLEAYESD